VTAPDDVEPLQAVPDPGCGRAGEEDRPKRPKAGRKHRSGQNTAKGSPFLVDCPDCGATGGKQGCWCGHLLPGGFCEARIIAAQGKPTREARRAPFDSAPPSKRLFIKDATRSNDSRLLSWQTVDDPDAVRLNKPNILTK
jgi:hypothetical protein